ncbi:hypothetical protein CcaCcLH18_01964 [Colletotrichum camelliae]|nr:hypothetical protein CcaCcLH18_01964 [Colletotrichum camelliae]
MDCQICCKQFSTSNALHEHIGFFQLQYHIRELLKCLAHVDQSIENRKTELDHDGSKEIDASDLLENNEVDDVDLEESRDLQCPRQSCEHWSQRHTYKELQRHFATRE